MAAGLKLSKLNITDKIGMFGKKKNPQGSGVQKTIQKSSPMARQKWKLRANLVSSLPMLKGVGGQPSEEAVAMST